MGPHGQNHAVPGAQPSDGVTPPRALGRGCRLALALLLLAMGWLYVDHPAGGFTAGGRAHGDGVYYYAYTRSLVFDRDVDFTNDYALLGDPHGHGAGPQGRPENRFAAGAGILWIPSFVVAHGLVSAGTALGWLHDPCDGTSRLHQRITLFGSVAWGFAAVVVAIRLASRYVAPPYAVAAGIVVTLASPLLWYMVYQPSWPHATSAFVVAMFTWRWHDGRGRRSGRGWAALGAWAGLMMLVRTQNALFLVLPAAELAGGLLTAARERDGRALRRWALAGALMLGATALTFAPQMWTWATLYGDPLVIPQGTGFMRWGDSKWAEALFSSRNGLFAWSPGLGPCVLGLVALAWAEPHARVPAGLLLLAFALQAYANGSVDDWWGGWAFGGRRFVGCTVIFVVGGAHAAARLHRVAQAHRRGLVTGGLVAAAAGLVSYSASFMWDYWHAQLERAASQPMQPATERWATRLVSGWYTVLGHPGAIPANLAHAWAAGVSPAAYDATSGWELATDRTRERGWDRISFPDPRWTGRGFGPREPRHGLPASVVEHAATFVLPVRHATALHAVFLLRPARPDTHVTVELGGHVIMERTLEPEWHWYRTMIPAEALEAGLNYAHVTQRLPPPEAPTPRAIGRTGTKVAAQLQVTADLEAEAPLRFVLGRTTVDVVERGVTAFAIDDADAHGPGLRSLGTFDTYRDAHAGRRLAEVVDRLPVGQVVVLGLGQSGLARWDRPAQAALAALGGQTRLDARSWDTRYVMIGVRGAAPGTALEALTHEGPAEVWVGRPASQRYEGVAWGKLTLWRFDVETPPVIAERELLPAHDDPPPPDSP